MRETVVVTEVTFIYVRGLTSAGIAAFLSACPIVCCCSEGFLLSVFRCWFRVLHIVWSAAMPSQDTASKLTAFMGLMHTSLYLRWGRSMVILPNACQITVNDVFVDATTLHTYSGHDTTIAVCIV